MKVVVVAHSILTPEAWQIMELEPEESWGDAEPDIDRLHEIAGRNCYQSWDRPAQATATNTGYMRNIHRSEHFSVLEHGQLSFYVEGISRSLTHELIRHRHLSFSELSQRFVNQSYAELITPPLIEEPVDMPAAAAQIKSVWDRYVTHFSESRRLYADMVRALHNAGYNRKAARGAARAILGEGTETKIVVSGNIRAWREFVQKRNTEHADAEIRLLAQKILENLRMYARNSVQDL